MTFLMKPEKSQNLKAKKKVQVSAQANLGFAPTSGANHEEYRVA